MSSVEQTWHNACDKRASPDEGGLMRGEKKEKWMALCEQAAEEQDPEKVMALVAEIDRLWPKNNSVSENKSPARKPTHRLTIRCDGRIFPPFLQGAYTVEVSFFRADPRHSWMAPWDAGHSIAHTFRLAV